MGGKIEENYILCFVPKDGFKKLTAEANKDKFADKKLLTTTDLCEYMSMGIKQVRKLLSDPGCPFVIRIDKRIYANKIFLDKWIDANTGHKKN